MATDLEQHVRVVNGAIAAPNMATVEALKITAMLPISAKKTLALVTASLPPVGPVRVLP